MITDEAFRELIHRVRGGDQQAAAELVSLFEPEIRRFIRVKLTDPHLGRVFDSVDIFQSVLANFFVRVVGGQFDLEEPGQLLKLLVTMAHNKIVDHARKPSQRKTVVGDSGLWEGLAGSEGSPSQIVARQELLQEVRRRMTDEELRLTEWRADGQSWQEIADAWGSTPDALRKKLDRALDRVCRELGVEEGRHE